MIRVAILTVSDSVISGKREDASGPALRDRCRELNWPVVEETVVPDDDNAIAEQLRTWADTNVAPLILTTGGTGVSSRDITPEATRRILDREIPGLGELMRREGMGQTKFSALSRGVAGIRKRSLIVNLPGSPRGAVYSFQTIQDLIPHVMDLLEGHTEHG